MYQVESDDEDEDGDDEGVDADDDGSDVGDANGDGSDEGNAEEEEDDNDADSGVSDMEENGDEDDEDDNGIIEDDGTIAQYDARSAAAVLRDINRWYRNHETPFLGRGGHGAWLDQDEYYDPPLAELYKQHSWPDAFDGDAFEVALERRHASARVKSNAEWPKSEATSLKSQLEHHDRDMERQRDRIASAETPGEEWAARWELFVYERIREDLARRLRENEELCEREFPGAQWQEKTSLSVEELSGGQWRRKADLPLLEYETLREDIEYQEKSKKWLDNKKEGVEEKDEQGRHDANGEGEEPPRKKMRRGDLNSLPPETRRATLLQRALEASRADAVRLCGADRVAESGDPATARAKAEKDVQAKREVPASIERDLEVLRQWAADLPAEEGTAATREKVEAVIARTEEWRDDRRDWVARIDKGLVEEFGTDAKAST
ncbi:hypothetical protein PG996_009285 [Apiospora saccharicola]|uniref:Uncharacterized protein n=1 Tax=Apiospora saccharicola TaxID=335842 RepID=A0ABR1UKB3_9PEZI